MFIAALFVMSKRWKTLKCSVINERTNMMWYIHTMECWLSLKRNEILTHATMWTNLEDIVLIKISWTQKDKY
jgi:hypothetical protein